MGALQGWLEKERFITPCDVSTKEKDPTSKITLTLWRTTLFLSIKYLTSEELRKAKNPRYFLRYLQRIASGLFIEFPLCLSSPREQPYSPWRVLFPSPLRFCHVTLGGSNRPYSQRRVALLASRARGCSRLFGLNWSSPLRVAVLASRAV
jgi:hypothetical protein